MTIDAAMNSASNLTLFIITFVLVDSIMVIISTISPLLWLLLLIMLQLLVLHQV